MENKIVDKEKAILLIGGGGHCRSVLDAILSTDTYNKIGIIDVDKNASVMDIKVVGTDGDLQMLFHDGWLYAFITIGSIGNIDLRSKLYNIVKSIGFIVPSIIDSSAIIAKDVVISEGTFVGKRVVINSGSEIGPCAILNTGSIIEHDNTIGEFVHVSPGATICGQVSIGNGAHIGAGSVIRQGISIGAGALIGAGSVVVKDIPKNVKAYGNPCRVVER